MDYTIKNRMEECDCEWCGCPLYVGDRVYTDSDERAFCSKSCGRAADEGVDHG